MDILRTNRLSAEKYVKEKKFLTPYAQKIYDLNDRQSQATEVRVATNNVCYVTYKAAQSETRRYLHSTAGDSTTAAYDTAALTTAALTTAALNTATALTIAAADTTAVAAAAAQIIAAAMLPLAAHTTAALLPLPALSLTTPLLPDHHPLSHTHTPPSPPLLPPGLSISRPRRAPATGGISSAYRAHTQSQQHETQAGSAT